MADKIQPISPVSITSVDSEDLQVIFDNVEDNLAFWQVVNNDTVRNQDDGSPVSLIQASAIADWLKMSSAPLYPSLAVGGLHSFTYRLVNLVIKLFGTPQIRFNRKFRDFLGELLLALQEYNTQAENLKSTVENLNDRLRTLEAENIDCRQKIETLSGQVKELHAYLDQLPGKRDTKDRF